MGAASPGVVVLVLAAVTVVASVLLPEGVPIGVVALGAVYGATTGLTALGIVLVHRASRVINLAQAEIGGLAVAVAVLTVTGWDLPYWLGVLLGILVAGATGAAVETVVVRRFRRSPRIIVTVATIGVAQLLGAAQLGIPGIFGDLRPFTAFTTPFDLSFSIGAIGFTGDHVVAVAVALGATAALRWFLVGSDVGTAIRAAAEDEDRARSLGIPVERLSLLTWVVAAVLSGAGAIVLTPIQGVSVGSIAGASALLPALLAAVIGRMTSLPITMAAAIGLGIFEQVVFWSYPRSSVVSVIELGLILVVMLVQRPLARRGEGGIGAIVPPVRPLPDWLRATRPLRAARLAGLALAAGLVVAAPSLLDDAQLSILVGVAVLAIVGASLVVLVGWASQISLGQFAFVGIGAGIAGGLVAGNGADLFLALGAASAVGAVAAVVVGLPALRIPGPFLAVATLAFAVAVSGYLLSPERFPAITPAQVVRPELFGAISIESEPRFWWFTATVAGLVLLATGNLRRSRVGRAVIAVRDNGPAAALYSLDPRRTKLLAFGVSGALAGLAGGLYVLSVRGVGFGAFNANQSIDLFTMVVVGGLGSLWGAVLGATYVQLVAYYLSGAVRLLASGAGLLLLLMVLPGGLGAVVIDLRDRWLARLVARRRLAGTGFGDDPEAEPQAEPTRDPDAAPAPPSSLRDLDNLTLSGSHQLGGGDGGRSGNGPAPRFALEGVVAGYGQQRILHCVSVEVGPGEVLGLLGTNGAGKSTLLRAATGLLHASGRVLLDGRPLEDCTPQERVAAGVGLMPGGAGVFPGLTVEENLRAAAWLLRRDPERAERVAEAMGRFPNLGRRRGTPAGALSGGEQQMLAISMTALLRPRVLLVDELSLGLAPTVVSELLEAVQALVREGASAIVVEQSLNVAAALAPRSVFLERGRVRFDGPTAELTERGDLARAVFLGASAPAPAGDHPQPVEKPREEPSGFSTSSRRSAEDGAESAEDGAELPEGPELPALPGAGPGRPGLSVADASVRFGGILAVDGASVAVAPGEIVGLIGSNGAGKTTLLDVCSGFTSIERGHVHLGGQDVTRWSADERAAHGLGRVFQDARLFPSLTVAETVAVAMERFVDVREPLAAALRLRATRRSEARVADDVAHVLDGLGLGPVANRFVSELSTGMRRIVELACVLAHRPATLLLDEPTSGLAQRESEALGRRLRRLRDDTGMSMLIVEHDIPMVRGLADRLVCMHLGAVIADGPPDEVLADPLVIESYLGTDERAIRRSGAATAPAKARRSRRQQAAASRTP